MKKYTFMISSLLILLGCKSAKTLVSDEGSNQEILKRGGRIEVVDKSHKAEDKEAGSLNREGIRLARQGKYAKAKELFEKAVEIESTNSAYYTNLGNLEMIQDNFSSAERYYVKAIELNPEDLSARMGLGSTYNDWTKYEKADSMFLWIVENHKNWKSIGIIYLNLAENSYNQSECLEALEYFEKAKLEIGYETEAQKAILDPVKKDIELCFKKSSKSK